MPAIVDDRAISVALAESLRAHLKAGRGALSALLESKHAMAQKQIHGRPGHQRRQPLEHLGRREHPMRRAISPRSLQGQDDAPVAETLQPLLAEGRPAQM